MTEEKNKHWIDIVFRKQAHLLAVRNGYDVKFWSILAAILAITSLGLDPFIKTLVRDSSLDITVFKSIINIEMILMWGLMLLGMKVPGFSRNQKKDIFFSRVESLEHILFFVFLFVAHLYLLIHDVTFVYWGMVLPLVILLVLLIASLSKFFSPRFKLNLLKKELSEYSQAGRRLCFNVGFTCIVAVIINYVLFFILNEVDLLHHIKVSVWLMLFIVLCSEARNTWEKAYSLPDLNEFEFELIADMYRTSKDALETYEKIILGDNAYLFVKNKVKMIEEDLKDIISELKFLEKELIRDNENEEILETLKLEKLNFNVSEREIKRCVGLIDDLNLSPKEKTAIKKNLEKKVQPNKIKIRKLLKNLQ